MKELLFILTLCGTPHYIIAQDTQVYMAGDPSQASQEALERIRKLLNSKDTIKEIISLEELTGLRCS